MSLFRIFDVASSGMAAQSVRLNLISSNLANADSVSTTAAGAYRARHPTFETVLASSRRPGHEIGGVRVTGIVESPAAPQRQYLPDHPAADEEGYVFRPNVNTVEEMANMISASRTFQNNVQVIDAARQILQRTLALGQG